MKAICALLVAAALVAGCQTAPNFNGPALVGAVCSAVPAEFEGLEADGIITGAIDDQIHDVYMPAFSGMCTAAGGVASGVTAQTIQNFTNKAIPVLVNAVNASGESDADKKTEAAILLGWQTTLNVAIPLYEALSTAPASSVSAQ
jgi:hypothetical protein